MSWVTAGGATDAEDLFSYDLILVRLLGPGPSSPRPHRPGLERGWGLGSVSMICSKDGGEVLLERQTKKWEWTQEH